MTTTDAPVTDRRANPDGAASAAPASERQPAAAAVTPSGTNGDARAAAVAEWLAAAAAGTELTGAQLAERYNRSPSWGRGVVRQARHQHTTTPITAAATTAATSATSPAAVTPAIRRTTSLAVVVVAAVAAVVSYEHMRALAELAGEQWRAAMLPLAVDGMMLAASMTALVRRRAGKSAGVAWAALLLGIAASVAASVAAAQPTLEGRLVAAWPPLALLLAIELALQQTRHDRERQP